MKVDFLGGNTKEEIEKRLKIVSAAGSLSRFNGTVTEVFETRNSYEDNLKLAKIVVGYGHQSIAEHDYLVFALENVTPIIEQIIIGYRLTSFTIKSRRNVDFSNVGFYTPSFKDSEGNILKNSNQLQIKYNEYMQSLFDKYNGLVNENLPVEDCRYILPYSYHSNIIMGCDAREFLNMTSDLCYGHYSKVTEVKELGKKFKEMIETYVPYLSDVLKKEKDKSYYEDKLLFLDDLVNKKDVKLLDKVYMTDYTDCPDLKVVLSALMVRYQISYKEAYDLLSELLCYNPDIKRDIIQAIIQSKNQREFEQVIFSYQMPISLAVLTHITRHRMHSLLLPDFTNINLDNYITPDTVALNHKNEYDEIFKNNKVMKEYFEQEGVNKYDLVYFLLSGNALNITTTMNARTLEWISRMRCCNKAQWEIRDLVNQMVEETKKVAPLIGEGLGSSCSVFGTCSEGKDSCKNRGVVKIKK